eukprot:Lithocolla_globosa_v1_NODE_223_length_5052_cov_23.804283.p3 type:complete len:126 gc:universal NODE_223_length_5052_cov_23.804283:4626-4249(-)
MYQSKKMKRFQPGRTGTSKVYSDCLTSSFWYLEDVFLPCLPWKMQGLDWLIKIQPIKKSLGLAVAMVLPMGKKFRVMVAKYERFRNDLNKNTKKKKRLIHQKSSQENSNSFDCFVQTHGSLKLVC